MWAASSRCSSAKRRKAGRSFSITPVERRPVLDLTGLGKRLGGGSLSEAALQQASERTADYAILPWGECG